MILIYVARKYQVSYKWLSRNYLVSSNEAKRLLQDYVEKHGTGLAVLYSISGFVKNNPSSYHVRLVSKPKLEEAKLDFDGNCSVQVYSVQSCIPKDPAALWNAEFVQAEELFKQPVAIDNCLRDNRLCGVLNSFVKRNGGAEPVKVAAHPVKSLGSGLSKFISAIKPGNDAQSEEKKFQQSTTTTGPRSSSMTKEVKAEPYAHASNTADEKTAPEKEKYPQSAADKKKAHVDQNSNRSSATLANMWGRAKPKPDNTLTETTNAASNSAAIAAAQTKVNEVSHCDSSDDDGQQVNTKRAGNRKRRVVFDFSDEEDELGDAVNLASPDLPNKKPAITMKQDADSPMLEKKTLFVEGNVEDKPKIVNKKDEKNNDLSLSEEPSRANNGNKSDASCNASKQNKGNDVSIDDKMANAAPVLPKRRKVLKTRINERGREVTDVVWEDEGVDSKSASDTSKETENSVKTEVNRFPATKKSPALATNPPQGGKGGNKKAGIKDPKQGNILSFFKKA
ncbi:hypothetical protein Leryth_024069 [Lithospermum erythrorhizon]|nr:hypothetical protein Leryth_024069 [Lithospermum erythrorhizon]